MAYVQLKGVSKRFTTRDGSLFTALDGVDLEFEQGEFVSVIGHSGCGKSTVLNLLAGLTAPSGGEIRVGGELVQGPGPERMVVFQNHSLLPWLTMRQNVALAVDEVHKQKTAEERRALVDRHIAMVRLTAAADRYPSQVSGGMKQRCGIARALSTRPKVLLLDEPFGALDALTRANLQDEVVKIWEADRLTVMMITHDVEEALLLSDRIVMMSNGPAACVAEIMKVELSRPRVRLQAINHPSYYRQRNELLYFLNKCKKEKNRKLSAVPAASGPAELPSGPASALEKAELVVGFVPLIDCAPLVIAEVEGIFRKNGLKVSLSREPSWKAVSDGIREGRLDAAQMVAGMPMGETLGIGGRRPFAMCTAMTLSRGGNAITFGKALVDAGVTDRASLRKYIGDRRSSNLAPLVFGVVHAASMHNLVLRAWLSAGGIDPDLDMTLMVIPPPQMVANLEQGNIAGYCVGEPWNLVAARKGVGTVCATDSEIWPTHPEKVLGVSEAWARRHPKTHGALVASLLEACKRCDEPETRRDRLPALLARPEYVGGRAEDFAACLVGPYGPNGKASDDLFTFSRGNANLCRTNETLWILAQMARWSMTMFPLRPEAFTATIYLEDTLRRAAEAAGTDVGAQDLSPIRMEGEAAFDPRAPLDYLASIAIHREIEVSPSGTAGPEPGAHIDAAE